jgi:hypothetical protein
MKRKKRCCARDACTQRRATSEARLEAAAHRPAVGVASSTFESPRHDALYIRSLSFDTSHQHFGVVYSAPHTYMYTLALRSLASLSRSLSFARPRMMSHHQLAIAHIQTNIPILLLCGPDHSPRLDRVGALMRRRTVGPRCIGCAVYCCALTCSPLHLFAILYAFV